MKKMFDHEVERIKKEFCKVCRTFLDVYGVAVGTDTAWTTSENSTDAYLWNRIGQLERELEAVAPGTGPRYDRGDPIEVSLHQIAQWCGVDDHLPVGTIPREAQYADNAD